MMKKIFSFKRLKLKHPKLYSSKKKICKEYPRFVTHICMKTKLDPEEVGGVNSYREKSVPRIIMQIEDDSHSTSWEGVYRWQCKLLLPLGLIKGHDTWWCDDKKFNTQLWNKNTELVIAQYKNIFIVRWFV